MNKLSKSASTLFMLRRMSEVRRFHTVRVNKEQTLGQHQYNVAMIVMLLLGDSLTLNVLLAALLHDAPEILTGDAPANVKSVHTPLETELRKLEQVFDERWLNLPALTSQEKRVVKFADLLEFKFYALEECKSGNEFMLPMYRLSEELLKKRFLNTVLLDWCTSYEMANLVVELCNSASRLDVAFPEDLFKSIYYGEG